MHTYIKHQQVTLYKYAAPKRGGKRGAQQQLCC